MKLIRSLPPGGLANFTTILPPEVLMEMMHSMPMDSLLSLVVSMPLKVWPVLTHLHFIYQVYRHNCFLHIYSSCFIYKPGVLYRILCQQSQCGVAHIVSSSLLHIFNKSPKIWVRKLQMCFQDVVFLRSGVVFAPHFLMALVEVEALGRPLVLRLWLSVCKGNNRVII